MITNNLKILPNTIKVNEEKNDDFFIGIQPTNSNIEKIYKTKAADPIKSKFDIIRISQFLIKNNRYRDNCLFILGCNIGLRFSDWSKLKVSDVVDVEGYVKNEVQLVEQKTSKTKGRKRNLIDLSAYAEKSVEEIATMLSQKIDDEHIASPTPKVKKIYLNKAVKKAIKLYLQNSDLNYDDFLFTSNSNNSKNINKPLTLKGVNKMLKQLAIDCKLPQMNMSTHTLRKTFGYHMYMDNIQDPRCLRKLQKIFQHSSAAQTLDYIGITNEEIEKSYKELNLGYVED